MILLEIPQKVLDDEISGLAAKCDEGKAVERAMHLGALTALAWVKSGNHKEKELCNSLQNLLRHLPDSF
jgi:hypothetical protein